MEVVWYIYLFWGQIDSLQQSVKGPAAAAFVPGLIGSCIVHLFVYIQEVHRISGQTGYAVCLPGTRKTKSFTSGTLTMEQKLQLATAWKAAAASDPVASRTTPKQLPPFIQHLSKSQPRPGLQVLYKVSRPGQTPQILFCKSFKDGTFEEQLKAAKICLYDQIQKGVIKPGRAACTKLGLPGE